MASLTRPLLELAEEVKQLHDQDEALDKARRTSKIQQREVRLKVGQIVAHLSQEEMRLVSERSGYTVARLRDFARVREAWPDGTFPEETGYTALEELARREDRFDLIKPGMSKRDARAAAGGKVDTPDRWSPQTKAAFAAEALKDPEVARALAADVEASAALARAEHQVFVEARDRRDAQEPGFKLMREADTTHSAIRQLIRARHLVTESLDHVMESGLSDDLREQVLQEVDRVSAAAGWFRTHLTSGDRSFEQELQTLLSEEG